jgi:hypothetical protein
MYNHKQSAVEVIRHGLLRFGLIDALDVWRRWCGVNMDHLRRLDMAAIFSEIYANGVWVADEGQDSLSGEGSTHAATTDLLGQLSTFLRDVGCRKLVDVGCGDFNWMRNVEGGFDYIGIDVVPELIERNNAKYADGNRRFVCMDATVSQICTGDVAICREVLFHLSFQDGLKLLRNIRAAHFKYVLLTTEKSVWFNADIRNGDHRRVNLCKAPFRLPQPLLELSDDKVSVGRVLAAWRAEALPR